MAGKTAAIIGGGFGIGRAVTLALAQAGVDVFIGDRDEDALAETCSAARDLGRKGSAMRCDVLSSEDVAAFYATVGRESECLDIVVNLAGGVRRGKLLDRSEQDDADDIRRNYGYAVQSYRLAIPLIRRSGRGGSITSFTTIEAHRGAAGFAVYAGAKAALTNFTRAMAVELGAEHIRCNCIAPDATPSRGNMQALDPDMLARLQNLPPEVRPRGYEIMIPQGTAPQLENLADALLFLASGLASTITGQVLHVDGGTKAASGFLNWPYGDGYVPSPLAGTLERLFPSEG